MKTFAKFLATLFLAAVSAVAQNQPTAISKTYITVGTGAQTSAPPIDIHGGYTNHALSWNAVSTTAVTGCSVQVDSSPDGVTWTAGGIIAAQSCNTNGIVQVSSIAASFARINFTGITAGSVSATYTGVNPLTGKASSIPTPPSSGQCFVSTGNTPGAFTWGSCSGVSSTNWSAIVPGTGTITAGTYNVGTGSSLLPTGTGVINATTMPWSGLTAFPTACTNQAVTGVGGTLTCNTITSAYVNSTIGLTANPLSQFASTTSAQLAGVISDETGTGSLVFAGGPAFTGTATGANFTLSGTLTLAAALNGCLTATAGVVTSTGTSCSSGIGSVLLNPTGIQNIIQPISSGATTQLFLNNFENIRYVTAYYNWSNTPGGSYTAGTPATLTLSSCPAGVSGTDTNFWFYITGGTGTAEAVQSAGTGTGTPGIACTVNFTPANSHSGAFVTESASTGIYEAYKDATAANPNNAKIVLSPTNPPSSGYYAIYAPITITGANIEIDGSTGATVDCEAWQQGCFVATAAAGPVYIHGFRAATKSTQNIAGGADAAVTNTACATNQCTITTTLNPPVGSSVFISNTFDPFFWSIQTVTSSSPTQFTYNCVGCSKASQATAGGVAYEFALVDTTSNGTIISHIAVDAPSGFQTRTFNNLVVVKNDQDFHLSDITLNSALGGCDSNSCSNGFYAPGPFAPNAAVIYIDHYNATLNCSGNGITNYSGNTLHVSDSIIQGFSQWGVATGTLKGGFGPTQLDNIYNEVGNCSNPLYPGSGAQKQAEAGLIEFGSSAVVHGGEGPTGQLPQFANSGNGGTRYNYYEVVTDSGLGHSLPLYCGYALVDSVAPTGSITVSCPRVQGTNVVSYDVLRSAGAISGGGSGVWPTPGLSCPGGSTTACGSILTAQPQQSTTLVSFTDTASANTTAYSIQQANYIPFVPFLPGASVLLTNADTNSVTNVATLQIGVLPGTAISTNFVEQNQVTSIVADVCGLFQAGFYAYCATGTSNGNNNGGVIGTLFQAWTASGIGAGVGLKGRINFPVPTGGDIQATHLITLVDSNTAKTLSSAILRPPWDANDCYIGLDQPTSGNGPLTAGLSFGCPVSISRYIGNVGDNTNWKERLTSAADTFAVPIILNGSTSGSATLSVSATGGTLNLGSTNASVDASGNLTVLSCAGCSAAVVPWSNISNATANLTLSNAGNATTFNQTSAVNWTWANTTAATASVSQSSPILNLAGTYWNGTASAADTWTIQDVVANGTNGLSQLTFAHSGSAGVASLVVPSGNSTTPGMFFGPTANNVGLFSIGGGFFAIRTDTFNLYPVAGSPTTAVLQISSNASTGPVIQNLISGGSLALLGQLSTQTGHASITISNKTAMSATAGTQIAVGLQGDVSFGSSLGMTFNPASGNANFVPLQLTPTINQTGTASGSYTAFKMNVVETALLGTSNRLLDFFAGSTGTTEEFSLDNTGKTVVDAGLTTAGLGHPIQIGAVNLTGRTAAITTTTVATVGATTTNYDIKAGVQCTIASASAAIQLTISYTDTSNTSQTITFPVQPSCTTLGAASVAYISQPIRAKNGTTISYATSITNTPTYDVFVDAFQLN